MKRGEERFVLVLEFGKEYREPRKMERYKAWSQCNGQHVAVRGTDWFVHSGCNT